MTMTSAAEWQDFDDLPPEAKKLIRESEYDGDISAGTLRAQFQKVGDWNAAFQQAEQAAKESREVLAPFREAMAAQKQQELDAEDMVYQLEREQQLSFPEATARVIAEVHKQEERYRAEEMKLMLMRHHLLKRLYQRDPEACRELDPSFVKRERKRERVAKRLAERQETLSRLSPDERAELLERWRTTMTSRPVVVGIRRRV
jgi:hypothetical protein